jgi:hypothetical protein
MLRCQAQLELTLIFGALSDVLRLFRLTCVRWILLLFFFGGVVIIKEVPSQALLVYLQLLEMS